MDATLLIVYFSFFTFVFAVVDFVVVCAAATTVVVVFTVVVTFCVCTTFLDFLVNF